MVRSKFLSLKSKMGTAIKPLSYYVPLSVPSSTKQSFTYLILIAEELTYMINIFRIVTLNKSGTKRD